MEALLILVGLAVLAVPIAVVALIVGHSNLRGDLRQLRTELDDARTRLSDLQRQLARGRTGPPSETAPAEPDAVKPDISGLAAAEEVTEPVAASEAEAGEPASPPPAGSETAPETPEPERPAAAQAGGPWMTKAPPRKPRGDVAAPANAPGGPPRAIVARNDSFQKLGKWLAANWFYAVSAVSLALAGIFLVQYGMENGLLPPRARVLAALVFGALLIGAGEYIRRRFGDDEDATTAYLPSVFSGAGIVTLFGGILAGRLLYDLIGPETALVGMVAVALVGLVLGWFHGPLLAAVGLIGGFAAPFIVGGSSDDPSWLYGYFAVLAVLGLGIDTMRRWAWISVVTLLLAYAAGVLLAVGDGTTVGAMALYVAVLAILAIVIPARSVFPDQSGTMIAEMPIKSKDMPWPEFPSRIAFGSMAATGGLLVLVTTESNAEFWLACGLLFALAALVTIWSRKATALQDVAILPAIGLLAAAAWEGADRRDVWVSFRTAYADNPEAAFPMHVTTLLALAGALSLLALWRGLAVQGSQARFGLVWAAMAALCAPVMAIILELTWQPAETIGAYPWALHAAALAALMVIVAERFGSRDGSEDRLRASLAVLSALSALSFAFTILFAKTALTLAILATVVAAAALDRQFRMPAMTAFIAVGVAVLGYRLIADPGLDFAIRGPLGEVVLVHGGALAGFVAAFWFLRGMERTVSQVILDSAAWSAGGLLLSLLLYRWLESLAGAQDVTHWGMGLYATIWLGLMAAQLQRLVLGGRLAQVRMVLAALFGLIGFGALLLGLTVVNPLFEDWQNRVIGVALINSLAVAYLLPALVLAGAAVRLGSLPALLRQAGLAIAGALALLWAFMVIRHFWQGGEAMEIDRGMTQPELYTYTIALLLAGAGLFYQSLARRSDVMRRAGLIVIGLAVAKVFLVDVSGLEGLTRVFSFLVLGLALAGLAWLGRWAERRVGGPGDDGPDGPPREQAG